jgi:hypothetical protein
MKATAEQLKKAEAWQGPGRRITVLVPADAAELEEIIPVLVEDAKALPGAIALLKKMRVQAGLDVGDCDRTRCRRCAVLRDVDAFLVEQEG